MTTAQPPWFTATEVMTGPATGSAGQPGDEPDPADLAASPAPDQWSPSVRRLVENLGDEPPLPAGDIISELVRSHPYYLDSAVDGDQVASGLGPVRPAAEHMIVAQSRWDTALLPELHGRQVILALVLDAGLGWPLLNAGVIASLVENWHPVTRLGPESGQVVWDLLSDAGRELADEQPLLAAALGAPAEWSVSAPDTVSAVAWAPSGDRLAFVAGGAVYEAVRGGAPRQVAVPQYQITSLAWSAEGVVAFCVLPGSAGAALVRLADGQQIGYWDSVRDGLLSGDGASGWLIAGDGLIRGFPAGLPSRPLGPAAEPAAVDWTGSHALVGQGSNSLLLADGLAEPRPASTDPQLLAWPAGGAQAVAAGPIIERPCALVEPGSRLWIAAPDSGGGVRLTHLPFLLVAQLATGPEQVTALSTDPEGTALAVAAGLRIGVWPLHEARPAVVEVPGYDSDQVTEDDAGNASAPTRDLLDADRDAQALASLIASERLKGPIAIGLFGAWGSGKSFVLGRIRRMLGEITAAEHGEGYLNDVCVVRFNAWQYAEVNLWASLVDQVLTEMGPVQPPEPSQHVRDAETAARQAEARAQGKAGEVAAAEKERSRVIRRRRLGWAALTGAGVVAAAVVVVVVLGGSARLAAGYGAVAALLTLASAAAAQVKRVAAEGSEVKEAVQDADTARAWLAGQIGTGAVDGARQKVLASRHDYEVAQQEAERLRLEASQASELSVSPQLGSVLQRMSALTEYRDQLSLVARTRDRFREIDAAVSAARDRRAQKLPRRTSQPEPGFERVVVMIDDLDRCPAEKVVTVLEAVHLLFDFEMFVVVIAVDTRWLDQSLRIRYRQLLGDSGAVPSDYLEKIIQIPLQLTPLNADLVRNMISGLVGGGGANSGAETGTRPPASPDPVAPAEAGGAQPAGQSRAQTASRPRPPRPPLPAEVLRITADEAAAMSAVAPLVGSTPRTVKRYVNTYRLLKARAQSRPAIAEPASGIADHEIVAFLLAIVTGQPELAAVLLPALTTATPGASLDSVLTGLTFIEGGALAPALSGALAQVRGWLDTNTAFKTAPATRFALWAAQIARFSFIPAVAFPGLADGGTDPV